MAGHFLADKPLSDHDTLAGGRQQPSTGSPGYLHPLLIGQGGVRWGRDGQVGTTGAGVSGVQFTFQC